MLRICSRRGRESLSHTSRICKVPDKSNFCLVWNGPTVAPAGGKRNFLTTRTTATTTTTKGDSGEDSPLNKPKDGTTTATTTITTTTTATDLHQSLFKNPIVQRLWSAREEAKRMQQRKQQTLQLDPTTSTTAAIKNNTPSSSRVQVSYPFSEDALLWETYKNPWGRMRMGRLLEDLDALAGNIAFFHVHNNSSSNDNDNPERKQEQPPSTPEVKFPVIVTASVDRIRLRKRPSAGRNQLLAGQVTWTGRSSMEIKMCCSEEGTEGDWLEAYVTFVTLDPDTRRPMAIPPVVPETDAEKREYELGAQRAALKKKLRQQQQHSSAAEENETDALARDLLQQASPLIHLPALADPHDILMDSTAMQNAMIAMPQTQNLNKGIFGGFLMRRAYELAFSTAYCFAGARPVFLEVDQVSFTLPVEVGDLLIFDSHVLYTNEGREMDYYQVMTKDNTHHKDSWNKETKTSDQARPPSFSSGSSNTYHEMDVLPLVHIEVEAWVTVPEQAKSQVSNQFYFTFAIDPPDGGAKNSTDTPKDKHCRSTATVRRVLPSNIEQARRMATRIRADQEQRKLDQLTMSL